MYPLRRLRGSLSGKMHPKEVRVNLLLGIQKQLPQNLAFPQYIGKFMGISSLYIVGIFCFAAALFSGLKPEIIYGIVIADVFYDAFQSLHIRRVHPFLNP